MKIKYVRGVIDIIEEDLANWCFDRSGIKEQVISSLLYEFGPKWDFPLSDDETWFLEEHRMLPRVSCRVLTNESAAARNKANERISKWSRQYNKRREDEQEKERIREESKILARKS